MKFSKKILTIIVMALSISLCIGSVSHANTILKYTETEYGYPIGKNYKPSSFSVCIDDSGKFVFRSIVEGGKFKKYGCITYNAKGKKTINSIKYNGDETGEMKVYGNRGYMVNVKNKLVVFSKKGKKLKSINLYPQKYLKKKNDNFLSFNIVGTIGKNKVRLLYSAYPAYGGISYGGVIDVNIATGKTKRLVVIDEFRPLYYDGKYVYNYEITDSKMTFYRQSLKAKKVEKFTVDKIDYDGKNYPYSIVEPSFYNGQIMAICPSGKIYYGTFSSKKIEQIGTVNKGKHFKKYAALDFVVKSKKEFYIVYGTRAKRKDKHDNSAYGKIFVDKYICR